VPIGCQLPETHIVPAPISVRPSPTTMVTHSSPLSWPSGLAATARSAGLTGTRPPTFRRCFKETQRGPQGRLWHRNGAMAGPSGDVSGKLREGSGTAIGARERCANRRPDNRSPGLCQLCGDNDIRRTMLGHELERPSLPHHTDTHLPVVRSCPRLPQQRQHLGSRSWSRRRSPAVLGIAAQLA
jgi:hypothetical protein